LAFIERSYSLRACGHICFWIRFALASLIASSAPSIFFDLGSNRLQLATKRGRIKKFVAEFCLREFARCAVRGSTAGWALAFQQEINE
jgi:hypothetical protein